MAAQAIGVAASQAYFLKILIDYHHWFADLIFIVSNMNGTNMIFIVHFHRHPAKPEGGSSLVDMVGI